MHLKPKRNSSMDPFFSFSFPFFKIVIFKKQKQQQPNKKYMQHNATFFHYRAGKNKNFSSDLCDFYFIFFMSSTLIHC